MQRQISAFANAARLAREGGYDGVEIMGSEGYLLNEFTAPAATSAPMRGAEAAKPLPLRGGNRAPGARGLRPGLHPWIYRLSMLDLVEGGNDWNAIVAQAKAVEAAGATLINTGIGWHEARIPTIATSVPRAAFAGVTAKLRPHVALPLVATNRINMPEWPRPCSRAAMPTWFRWRGRCSPIRNG